MFLYTGLNFSLFFVYIAPDQYDKWFVRQVDPKTINLNIIQMNKPLAKYYNTIKSQDFIENFEDLWAIESKFEKKQTDINMDLLNISVKTCKERLPPLLNIKDMEFGSEDMIAFIFYKVNILVKPIKPSQKDTRKISF